MGDIGTTAAERAEFAASRGANHAGAGDPAVYDQQRISHVWGKGEGISRSRQARGFYCAPAGHPDVSVKPGEEYPGGADVGGRQEGVRGEVTLATTPATAMQMGPKAAVPGMTRRRRRPAWVGHPIAHSVLMASGFIAFF